MIAVQWIQEKKENADTVCRHIGYLVTIYFVSL